MENNSHQAHKPNGLTGFGHPVTVTANNIHIDIQDARDLMTLMQVPANIEWVRENLADPTEPPYWRIHAGEEVIGIHEGMYSEFYRQTSSGDRLRDHIESMLRWLQYGSITVPGGLSSPGRPYMPPMKRKRRKR